jgi:enterochelin esterase-like enzyme
MGLTSSALVVTAGITVIGTLIATLMLWNALPAAVRWPGRVALLLVGDLIAIVLVAILVNDSFGFYTSWAELFGSHPVLSTAAVPAGREDALLAPRLAVAAATRRGLVTTIEIPGTVSGVGDYPADVYLPPQYGSATYRSVRFPVLELLDGFPGGPQIWIRKFKIADVLDHEIAAGMISPTIVVMPTQNLASPRDTECANVVGGPQVDTYLVTDVHNAVVQAFRAADDGRQWGLSGYSTGGYCAALLAAQHPADFGAAASIEGYNKPAHDLTTGRLFGTDIALQNEANVLYWVNKPHWPSVPILELATKQDRQSWVDDRILDRFAGLHHYPLWQIYLPRGGHNLATFSAEVPLALHFLSERIGAPLRPAPSIDGLLPYRVGPPTVPTQPAPTGRPVLAHDLRVKRA